MGKFFLLELKKRNMKVDFINLHYYCVKDCDNEKGKSDFYKYIKSWRDWIDNDLKLSLPVVPIIFPK